jgi:hypothetical protein
MGEKTKATQATESMRGHVRATTHLETFWCSQDEVGGGEKSFELTRCETAEVVEPLIAAARDSYRGGNF